MSTQSVIVVDLDGTLVKSDLLVESVFLFLSIHPLKFFYIFIWLLHGKVYFKRRLADAVIPDTKNLPFNHGLLLWLQQQRDAGRQLVLATASDKRIAECVAEHLGIFDEVMSTETQNLSSKKKQLALIQRFGEKNYEYIGNSSADLAVWRSASVIHVANPELGVLSAARKLGSIGEEFSERPAYLATLIKALRLHQWAKNTLLFVPLLASHRLLELQLLWQGVLAFVVFGLCASSVYLLNDLIDLKDDRQSSSKSNRPLASGDFPVLHAMYLFPGLLILAFVLAAWALPIYFALVLAGYYFLTLSYTLCLKRVVMLDVVTLAMLYTLRVIAGAAAMSLDATFWILAFCMFIFISLAFVKRYAELHAARLEGKRNAAIGRDYYPEDLGLLVSLGGASGYISVLVLALYIKEAGSATLYSQPEWMWAACPLLLFWLSRTWMLAYRGKMHEDPVLFAIKDCVSLIVGSLLAISFWLAI